jgi:hypothetical protein
VSVRDFCIAPAETAVWVTRVAFAAFEAMKHRHNPNSIVALNIAVFRAASYRDARFGGRRLAFD